MRARGGKEFEAKWAALSSRPRSAPSRGAAIRALKLADARVRHVGDLRERQQVVPPEALSGAELFAVAVDAIERHIEPRSVVAVVLPDRSANVSEPNVCDRL